MGSFLLTIFERYKAINCPQLRVKKVEARRFCAKYNLDDQVVEDQNDMPLDDVFMELRRIREALLRSIIGRVGVSPVIEPPFNFGYGCNIVIGDQVYANVKSVPFPCVFPCPLLMLT